MYVIFTYISVKFMKQVDKYSSHMEHLGDMKWGGNIHFETEGGVTLEDKDHSKIVPWNC